MKLEKQAQPMITAEGLTRIYSLGNTDVIGINQIDLKVYPGELMVLKGNSGSGKSTLLALLAALDRPTRGRLLVAGHDLNTRTSTQLTRFRREVVGVGNQPHGRSGEDHRDQ